MRTQSHKLISFAPQTTGSGTAMTHTRREQKFFGSFFQKRTAFLLLFFLVSAAPATAQDASTEDRLRDALRQSTADLRAAQDNQTALQAQVDQLTKQVAQLQAQAQPTPPPAAATAPLQQEISTLQQQNNQLQAGLQKWQTAYAQAATIARAQDLQAKQETASSTAAQSQLNSCTQANTQLVATANSILNLYQTQSFRALLLKSYEPLIGLWQVKLDNIVQNYQEKINAQIYYPSQTPPPGTSTP
jgi:hypothetical protein